MRGMRIGEFKLERFFDRYEFTAPYLLCTSDCESVGLDELLMLEPEAREGLSSLRLGYIEAAGTPALRQAVADMYSTIAAEEVLLQAGSSEAIFSFMNCALTAGDHVVVQTPCYQSHYEVARALGCDVSSWTGDEENGWALDPDALRSL
ncbi:MAG TPA: aminotransferase class I/II-fold pyridoxal phosphate-dependent enzyme, partial [Candidatus Eremiobacteraceae bacterium]|nr:aminotransferase class I/II-fold pyridoxal phosphate-dependent enzyme [Candidatus Eremiobacteraceae bacterium]